MVTSLEQAGLLVVLNLESAEVETVAVGGCPHGLVVQDGATRIHRSRARSGEASAPRRLESATATPQDTGRTRWRRSRAETSCWRTRETTHSTLAGKSHRRVGDAGDGRGQRARRSDSDRRCDGQHRRAGGTRKAPSSRRSMWVGGRCGSRSTRRGSGWPPHSRQLVRSQSSTSAAPYAANRCRRDAGRSALRRQRPTAVRLGPEHGPRDRRGCRHGTDRGGLRRCRPEHRCSAPRPPSGRPSAASPPRCADNNPEGGPVAGPRRGAGIGMRVTGICEHGGGLFRSVCGREAVAECVYCGKPFCETHGEKGPDFTDVCDRKNCQVELRTCRSTCRGSSVSTTRTASASAHTRVARSACTTCARAASSCSAAPTSVSRRWSSARCGRRGGS